MMFTIIKANKRQFTIQKPFDYGCRVLMMIMLAAVPLSFIYYLVDCLVRKG
jgi:hypothetical protein